uniref:Uncharacterized protein n=1 Tax=Strigamia maritima TaxID=126957 RepID=T1JBZ6_STRMM
PQIKSLHSDRNQNGVKTDLSYLCYRNLTTDRIIIEQCKHSYCMGSANSSRRETMDEREDSDSRDRDQDSDTSEPDPDIATILQYLIRSGQVRIITSEGNRFGRDDSDEDFCSLRSNPQIDPNPDTSAIDKSELKTSTLQSTGRNHCLSCRRPNKLIQMIAKREIGMFGSNNFTRGDCSTVSSSFLPNKLQIVSKYKQKAFCGTYSRDGNIFLTACQDRNIRIYSTKDGDFKLFKTIPARDVGWSILDTAFSPSGNHLIYSSWSECIHLCNIYGNHEVHEALPLCPDDRRFSIFSVMFSQDGSEILGGANDGCLYVYDTERKLRTLRIESHEDDVNSVAFADNTSQILFSGGDDGLCKVWDRRMMSESDPKPVGILAGHRDGITFVDSKNDGRHLITNCKDQTIKLWDMRVFSPTDGQESTRRSVTSQHWDYRWQSVPKKLFQNKKKLAGDTSLMTYCGHSVLQTLIRCHFSPEFTTGQRYIYTGCANGKIIIYDLLTGKIECVLSGHRGCVRDVSWHPYKHEIISTSWDGQVGQWVYSEDQVMDSEDEDEQSRRAEALGLRRSKRIAEKRQKLMRRNSAGGNGTCLLVTPDENSCE